MADGNGDGFGFAGGERAAKELLERWAISELEKAGAQAQEMQLVADGPWSKCIRLSCSDGRIRYAKLNPGRFAGEVAWGRWAKSLGVPVPECMAEGLGGCAQMSMDWGGETLGAKAKALGWEACGPGLLGALSAYSAAQLRSSEDGAGRFPKGLWAGWATGALAAALGAWLQTGAGSEISGFTARQAAQACAAARVHEDRLLQAGVPDGLEHGDFQPNNIVAGLGGQAAVIDWPEAQWSHPFFSWAGMEASLCSRGAGEKLVARARDVYLDPWRGRHGAAACDSAMQACAALSGARLAMALGRVYGDAPWDPRHVLGCRRRLKMLLFRQGA